MLAFQVEVEGQTRIAPQPLLSSKLADNLPTTCRQLAENLPIYLRIALSANPITLWISVENLFRTRYVRYL